VRNEVRHGSFIVTCREFTEFLAAYLDAELAADERMTFEAHLAGCAGCVAYLRTYENAVVLARGALGYPDDPLPADVPEELVRAMLAARRKV